jgi:hypothetical protein
MTVLCSYAEKIIIQIVVHTFSATGSVASPYALCAYSDHYFCDQVFGWLVRQSAEGAFSLCWSFNI